MTKVSSLLFLFSLLTYSSISYGEVKSALQESQGERPVQNSHRANETNSFNSVTSKSNDFSILVPANWSIDENFEGLAMVLKNPANNSRTNVVLFIENVTEGLDSKKYYDTRFSTIKEVTPGYSKISDGKIGDSYSITYTSKTGELLIKQTTYFLVKNGKGYALTATDYEKHFDKNAPLFDKIATSIHPLQ